MPKRKATPAAVSAFVYIGAGGYGMHKVSDAPGYKKGAKTKLRTGILITRADEEGGPLREVGFHDGPGFGWLAYSPANGHLYGVSTLGMLHSFAINKDGSLTELHSVDTVGGSAHLEVADSGRYALVANYGDGVLATFELLDGGRISEAKDSIRAQLAGSLPWQIIAGCPGRFRAEGRRGAAEVLEHQFSRVGPRGPPRGKS